MASPGKKSFALRLDPALFTALERAATGDFRSVNAEIEVLLREAHDHCALPVAVFRSSMILACTSYTGQLNPSDVVTRMVYSLVTTGIAPESFFPLGADGRRQRIHFDGLPVDFIAEAIDVIGARTTEGYQTYHVMNPHDDGIGPDEFVDWLIDAGYPIRCVKGFGNWFQQFENSLRALPQRQRQSSVLQMLRAMRPPDGDLRAPDPPRGPAERTDRFLALVLTLTGAGSRAGSLVPALLGPVRTTAGKRRAAAASVGPSSRGR